MRSLEKGKDKIQQLCDVLRKETLEPAEKRAEEIVVQARSEAERIVQEGKEEVAAFEVHARERLANERQVFESSMRQTVRQAVEALRQQIENRLFGEELSRTIVTATSDPGRIARLIDALVGAVVKDGLSADFSAEVPKQISVEEMNEQLLAQTLDHLREKEVVLGDFEGGVKIRLHDQQMTVDISDQALKELLERYMRKDFRKFLFG